MTSFKNTHDDWDLILAKLHLFDKAKQLWQHDIRDWVTQDLLEVDTLYELRGADRYLLAVSWGLAKWLRGVLSQRWAGVIEAGRPPGPVAAGLFTPARPGDLADFPLAPVHLLHRSGHGQRPGEPCAPMRWGPGC